LCTRRRERGVTRAPIRTRDVAQATALRVTHGSASSPNSPTSIARFMAAILTRPPATRDRP
jgi:hypothetical protein